MSKPFSGRIFPIVSLLFLAASLLTHAGPVRDLFIERILEVRDAPDSPELVPKLRAIIEMMPDVRQELQAHIAAGEHVKGYTRDLNYLPTYTQELLERIHGIQAAARSSPIKITEVFLDKHTDFALYTLASGNVQVKREGDSSKRESVMLQFNGYGMELAGGGKMVVFEAGETSKLVPYMLKITMKEQPSSFYLQGQGGQKIYEMKISSFGEPTSKAGEEEMEKKPEGEVQVLSGSSYPLRLIELKPNSDGTKEARIQNVSDARIEARVWKRSEYPNNGLPSRLSLDPEQFETANASFKYLTGDDLPLYFQIME